MLLLRTMPGSMALPQPESVLMSVAPVTTQDSEDTTAQNWPCLSLTAGTRENRPYLPAAAALRRVALYLAWAAQ